MKLVVLRKPDASSHEGVRGYRAIALMRVMVEWYSSLVVQMLNTKESKGWRRQHVGAG